ncbi:flagellar export protein FliJ [Halarsenatibacter silvermanii]|uniref:Flagellar FliJ protein n=1 Tax=Halarsenatibacter silvermanii TaxID=321763 RepID=A0A1G9MID2_9FIRM|nr:flagellar export protein FliJ [Halarsenatibacter silvermanii]SDL73657.1 flagellar FliJ protein [Halarsenatibacter silvermanii]
MKKFDFDLKKVLKVRTIREELAQAEFLKARQQARQLEDEVDNLACVQEKVYDHIRKKSNPDPEMALQARRYLKHNRQEIDNLQENLSQQKEVVYERREELRKKSQKKQAMERLKENQSEVYYKELQKDQQKIIDDLARHFTGSLDEDEDVFPL